ncbi:MAG: helix-hairpin-helix domain-containing protein [Bacillota bacterium]
MKITQKPYLVLLLAAVIVIFGSGVYYAKSQDKSGVQLTSGGGAGSQASEVNTAPGEKTITVHVAGQVTKPGVYEFSQGTRINEAVNKAVPLPDADLHSLNLAEVLKDGQRIVVPSIIKDNTSLNTTQSNAGNTGASQGKVNINMASQQELETLPGIGPALAQRIISYREQKGSFKTIEEIQDVSGIGIKKFEAIQDLISVY